MRNYPTEFIARLSNALLAAAIMAACSKSSTPAAAPAPGTPYNEEAVGYAPEAPAAPSADLPSALSKQLGISSDQASAGIGTILGYARGKLPAGDYQKVASAIPGATDNLDAAEEAGALAEPIGDPGDLTKALGKVGIPPEIVSQFVPAVTDYAGKVGGPEVRQLLAGLFP